MGRPVGVKNGQGVNRDMAESTACSIRLQRPQSLADLQAIVSNGIYCTFCGKSMLYDPFILVTKDHVVAFDKGGRTSADNLISIHRSCNSAKNNDDIDNFLFHFLASFKNPRRELARVDASIAKQLSTPVEGKIGALVWEAFRQLTEDARATFNTSDKTTEDRRDYRAEMELITTLMVVEKALAIASA